MNSTDPMFNMTWRMELSHRLEDISFVKGYDDGCDDNCPPLIYASQNGHLECVELLVKAGADVNVVDLKKSKTPLGQATRNGYHDVWST